jgi:hypothetical protein
LLGRNWLVANRLPSSGVTFRNNVDSAHGDSKRSRLFQPVVWVALLFSAILGATRTAIWADTPVYAADIADHLGKSPFGPGNSLWEFGHLLWRPLGWVLTSVAAPLLSEVTDWTPPMEAVFVLITVSVVCSIVTVVVWYLLVSDITQSRPTAFLVTIAMACSNGFLFYACSGPSYVTGVMCLTISVFFLYKGRIAPAAFCFALSALFWLPYILAGPALLVIALRPARWSVRLQDFLRSIQPAQGARFAAISAACILTVYGLALGARQISSVEQAKEWYSEANHGWSQSIRVVRIATGLPRSLLSLGRDGMLYKRFLIRDPYAPVALRDLVKASLWKIAAFFLFAICFFYELLRRHVSALPLLIFLAVGGPVMVFAVYLFEPGSPERYLPMLPFLVMTAGWILRDCARARRPTQIVVASFLLCIVANNTYAVAAPSTTAEDQKTRTRIAGLRDRLNGGGVAVIATYSDSIAEFVGRSPFSKLNRPEPFPLYDVIEPATLRVLMWREECANKVLTVWGRGGEVWISKRLLSARPRPDWYWVEGDDPRITWPELPRFFSSLQTDGDINGEDGFLRLARNDANWSRLAPLAALYHPPAPRAATPQ